MSLTTERLRDFLFAEARYLDDKQWDEWLDCYDKDVRFWVPSWDDDGSLVEDPEREISLMFYAHRDGLEDRVFRIRTEKSSASTPPHRTCHSISNVEVLANDGTNAQLRFNWVTHSHRYKTTDVYFGTSFYSVTVKDGALKITDKKVVIKNDYIHHVVDVYHL